MRPRSLRRSPRPGERDEDRRDEDSRVGKHRYDVAGRVHLPLTAPAEPPRFGSRFQHPAFEAHRRARALKGPRVLALDGRLAAAGYADGTVAVADLLEPGADAPFHAAVSFLSRNMADCDYAPDMG